MDDIEKCDEKPEGKIEEFSSVFLRAGLYIVATPIGNLRDITLRALDVLRGADVIYCEDTRVSRKLCSAYQIKAPLRSYHDHSDDGRRVEVCSNIAEGKVVALISDAGMPLVSDPGYKLVRACYDAGHYVTSVPGANAPLAALQVCGMPSAQFAFLGFLPTKNKARCDLLSEWADVPSLLIAFESAPRLIAALGSIHEVFGVRDVAVVRELTKMYEEVRRGKVDELIAYYKEYGAPKGEIVLVIGAGKKAEISSEDIDAMLLEALKEMKTKDAAAYVAEQTGKKKSDLYARAVEIGKSK